MNVRNYSYKDVDMLMASRTVATNLSNNLDELSMARSNWTAEFAKAFNTKIDNAIENYLGLDKKKAQRDATAVVLNIQAAAKREVSFLKTQIEVDFPEIKTQILKELGSNPQADTSACKGAKFLPSRTRFVTFVE